MLVAGPGAAFYVRCSIAGFWGAVAGGILVFRTLKGGLPCVTAGVFLACPAGEGGLAKLFGFIPAGFSVAGAGNVAAGGVDIAGVARVNLKAGRLVVIVII